MANYYACTRTSYFRVNDLEKLKDILRRCSAEDTIDLYSTTINGEMYYAFGCESSISGLREEGAEPDDEASYPALIAAIQEIIFPGEAMVIMEAGHEKLRYVVGEVTVITKDSYEGGNIRDMALKMAGKLLGNPGYEMQMEY